MPVTTNDLLALGLLPGPDFGAALHEANRLGLTGAALQTFVWALMPACVNTAPAPDPARVNPASVMPGAAAKTLT